MTNYKRYRPCHPVRIEQADKNRYLLIHKTLCSQSIFSLYNNKDDEIIREKYRFIREFSRHNVLLCQTNQRF